MRMATGADIWPADGHSIQVGGMSFLIQCPHPSVADPSSAPDIDMLNSDRRDRRECRYKPDHHCRSWLQHGRRGCYNATTLTQA